VEHEQTDIVMSGDQRATPDHHFGAGVIGRSLSDVSTTAVGASVSVRLRNVPTGIDRVIAFAGAGKLVQRRRDADSIAIAMTDSVEVVHANALREALTAAMAMERVLEVVEVSCNSLADSGQWAESRAVVVPPIQRWIGLRRDARDFQSLRRVLEGTENIIGVGTGTFVLAVTGALDEHDVVAAPEHAVPLSMEAPAARVLVGTSVVSHGRLITVPAGSHAIPTCVAIVAGMVGRAPATFAAML
jgi:transcriptional regulator GlxA family with amidase domain